ncbi:hypothetical protein PAMP_011428 [Pampus punctatissimus]
MHLFIRLPNSDGCIKRGPINILPEGTQKLPSMAMTSPQTQSSSGSFHYYGEMLNLGQQHHCMPTLPECPVQFQHECTQNRPSTAMANTQIPQPLANTRPYYKDGLATHNNPTLPSSTGDLNACQLRNPGSSFAQGVAGASSQNPQKPVDALQKRELRLIKNREAARQCRQKKKEYVKCLENRVDVLENQNKTLIEELRALKDIYRHKAE